MLMNKFSEYKYEVGIDEAGRGSLAGPVTAAAVILGKNFKNKKLDDSKKLSPKKRLELKKYIEKNALAYSVAFVDSSQIDKNNILNSTFKAMHMSLKGLDIEPDFIIVDGNLFKQYKDLEYKCIIKGDQKYQNIAAASILAKTYRDEYMTNLHLKWKSEIGHPDRPSSVQSGSLFQPLSAQELLRCAPSTWRHVAE